MVARLGADLGELPASDPLRVRMCAHTCVCARACVHRRVALPLPCTWPHLAWPSMSTQTCHHPAGTSCQDVSKEGAPPSRALAFPPRSLRARTGRVCFRTSTEGTQLFLSTPVAHCHYY